MKFFEDNVLQARKRRHLVCGDFYLCKRTPDATVAVLCDGIGSGVYANVAAITCGNRLMEMVEGGRSLRAACEHVADSMNRARTEEMPFAAFVAVRILPGGQYTAYSFENPGPIHVHENVAAVCPQEFIALEYEMISESAGTLALGDHLLMCSDGVTHAGLGGGFATGWGIEGVSQEINAYLRADGRIDGLLSRLMRTSYNISGKAYWDDTSLVMITCREANELCVLTGPPANHMDDGKMVQLFDSLPGKKIICGSTTTSMASRELGRPAKITTMDIAQDRPPAYEMEGIALVTEGAVTLNQVMNLLEEEIDCTLDDSPVFLLCRALREADVITFLVGSGYNAAQYADTLFRQLGIVPRQKIIKRIAKYLQGIGKATVLRTF